MLVDDWLAGKQLTRDLCCQMLIHGSSLRETVSDLMHELSARVLALPASGIGAMFVLALRTHNRIGRGGSRRPRAFLAAVGGPRLA
jgi:hypothetical protein